MSRRHSAKKREIKPDSKYGSIILTKFINNIMMCGKKAKAEGIVYRALEQIKQKYKIDPFESFKTAIANVMPQVEVTSLRVGGANYQVPSPVSDSRAQALAIRWLTEASKKRSEKTMIDKLATELYDAVNKKGSAIKKREDTHKMAEANRAFAHFAAKKI